MEGRFESGPMAGITLIGQPNVAERRLDNPIVVPGMLSFLAYGTFHADVAGPGRVSPRTRGPTTSSCSTTRSTSWPGSARCSSRDGTRDACSTGAAAHPQPRPMLWVLMLAFPFPYIATTAGWMTAELAASRGWCTA